MSKSSSGLFSGTVGANKFGITTRANPFKTKGLDLREHPTKYNILDSAHKKEIKQKIASRTATRDDYKTLSSNERLSKRRQKAVRDFWRKERERLQDNKKGTRNWTQEQIQVILKGQRPKYKGKTLQGHHMYSVQKYPHLANRYEIIYPATFNEHLQGWHGGNFKDSKPGRPIKYIKDF